MCAPRGARARGRERARERERERERPTSSIVFFWYSSFCLACHKSMSCSKTYWFCFHFVSFLNSWVFLVSSSFLVFVFVSGMGVIATARRVVVGERERGAQNRTHAKRAKRLVLCKDATSARRTRHAQRARCNDVLLLSLRGVAFVLWSGLYLYCNGKEKGKAPCLALLRVLDLERGHARLDLRPRRGAPPLLCSDAPREQRVPRGLDLRGALLSELRVPLGALEPHLAHLAVELVLPRTTGRNYSSWLRDQILMPHVTAKHLQPVEREPPAFRAARLRAARATCVSRSTVTTLKREL